MYQAEADTKLSALKENLRGDEMKDGTDLRMQD